MDASETLDYVRRLVSFPVTCDSGRRYTLVLPSMERMIVTGSVPLPIMRKAAKFEANGDELPEEERAKADQETGEAAAVMYEMYDRLLIEGVIEIEGEPVTLDESSVKLLEEDREELLEYLKREKDPKAEAPT